MLYFTSLILKNTVNRKKKFKRNKFKTKSFVKSLEKKMLDIERYMETFQESISKRFEKQENNFKNLTDKMKSFEVTQREYKKRLSRLEDQRNEDENEDIELQKVKNFNYFYFSHFSIFINFKSFYVLDEIQIWKFVRDKRHSRKVGDSLF